MARPLRVEYSGAFYHVINQGNAGEKIFKSPSDKEKFLEYLQKTVNRFSLILHTYCLMGNHYHLLVETPKGNLGVAIQWLNVSYATYYNKKHQRRGHLFQGRFQALLIEADEYLKELSRYIHLNPVRVKLVAKPEEYSGSSYPAFLGKKVVPEWLETGRILRYFGKKEKEAIKKYKEFVEEIELKALENPNKKAVGGEFGSKEEEILERGRKRNKAREVAIYLARDLSGARTKELGEYFGNISGAAITMRYNQVSRAVSRDKRLRGKINKIKKQIINI